MKKNLHTRFRELSFEEWIERGEIDDYVDCRNGIEITNEIEGLQFTFRMNEDELSKLGQHLLGGYWNEVNWVAKNLVTEFEKRWQENSDPIMLEREIELIEYWLYPEKVPDGTMPLSVRMLSEDEKDYMTGVRYAYARILSHGRYYFTLPHQRHEHGYCYADALKYYLGWLIEFKDSLNNSDVDTPAVEEIELDHQSNAYQQSVVQDQQKLQVTPAALLLRYRGTHMQDPQSDKLRTADSIALKLCGLDSGSSGLNLYRFWRNIVIGESFQTSIINAFKIEPQKTGRIIRKRLKDLAAAAEFEQDSDIKERIQSNYDSLKSEYERLK